MRDAGASRMLQSQCARAAESFDSQLKQAFPVEPRDIAEAINASMKEQMRLTNALHKASAPRRGVPRETPREARGLLYIAEPQATGREALVDWRAGREKPLPEAPGTYSLVGESVVHSP